MQLRFASLVVVNLREDFHLQDRDHAGRTTKTPAAAGVVLIGPIPQCSNNDCWIATEHTDINVPGRIPSAKTATPLIEINRLLSGCM